MSEAGEGPLPHVGFAPGLTIGRVLPLYSRSAAFALPGPMPQGVSYVQISVVYIRNIMPFRAPPGLSRVQSKPLPGRARTPHPPARPDLFSPNVGIPGFSEDEMRRPNPHTPFFTNAVARGSRKLKGS